MSAENTANDGRRITREDTELLELAARAGAAKRRYLEACRGAGVPRREAEGVLSNFTSGWAAEEPVPRYRALKPDGRAASLPDPLAEGSPGNQWPYEAGKRTDFPTEGSVKEACMRVSYDCDETRFTIVRVDDAGGIEEVPW